MGKVYYKIRSVIDDIYSGYSSADYINFQGLQKEVFHDSIFVINSDNKIFQNHPNPFNPSTKIKYSLPENSFVEIKVFNIYGEEVKTLVNAYKTAGEYSVDFNGENLASGVYLYSIKTNNYSAVKKMILQK